MMCTSERGTCGEWRASVRGKKQGNQACLWGCGPHRGGEANASQPGQAPVCGQGTRFAIESSVAWVTLRGKSKMRGLVGFVLALRGMRLAL